MAKKLYKSRTNIKIDGVCAGIAKYVGIDTTIVRLAMVAFAWFGWGLLLYLICALIIPREPSINADDTIVYEEDSNGRTN